MDKSKNGHKNAAFFHVKQEHSSLTALSLCSSKGKLTVLESTPVLVVSEATIFIHQCPHRSKSAQCHRHIPLLGHRRSQRRPMRGLAVAVVIGVREQTVHIFSCMHGVSKEHPQTSCPGQQWDLTCTVLY